MNCNNHPTPSPSEDRRVRRRHKQQPPVLLLTIGIDADGHVCKREGFLREGALAQMEAARHSDYLLDVLGREQQEAEWKRPIVPLEAVTGWQQAALVEQLQHERRQR